MLIHPYRLEELQFAYCYRIYLRSRTHQGQCRPALGKLSQDLLDGMARSFDIHVLESTSSETEVLLLVSLRPEETVSGCASKLKGQISKWLRESLQLRNPTHLLSRGYFACTTGKSAPEAIERYLNEQSEHHGYAQRQVPPVFVGSYDVTSADERPLQANHAYTHLQFHLVLATWRRKGVFGSEEAEAVAHCWQCLGRKNGFLLRKVSFVPDHVHVALRVHPTVSPANLVVVLMNAAQEIVFERFGDSVIRARVERLWQPSAYLGSYGELTSPAVRQYIRNWETEMQN